MFIEAREDAVPSARRAMFIEAREDTHPLLEGHVYRGARGCTRPPLGGPGPPSGGRPPTALVGLHLNSRVSMRFFSSMLGLRR